MSLVKYVDRNNTNSIKWDAQTAMFGQEGLMPFWVADMDFQVADCVTEALTDYLNMGALGYYAIPDSYYEAIISWEMNNHNSKVKKDWIRFSPGVVSAFHWLVQFLTEPQDSVMVMTPVYYPFFHAVESNDRKLVVAPLTNTHGYYEMNFADIEEKIIKEEVKLLIFCSPHNPVGRVWTQEELEQLFTICKKHDVLVISDEIHQDLTYGEHKHISALTMPEYYDRTYVLTAPSKTFNLAACQNSVIIIPDETLRGKWDTYIEAFHGANGNAFGYIAAEAAYSKGQAWFDEVKDIIHTNYLYVQETLAKELPEAVVSPLEGTYLLWIDLRHYVTPDEVHNIMQEKCRLAFDYGEWFGGDDYKGFIRMNLATSQENIQEAVKRIVENL